MRILVISNLYPPHYLGGYELLCAQVVEALRDRGHDVLVLTSHFRVDDRDPPQEEGVARDLELYLPFGQPPRLSRRRRYQAGKENARKTQQWLADFQPDVVFVWSQLRLTVGAARAAEASKIPVLYTFNDTHPFGYLPGKLVLGPRGLWRLASDWLLMRSGTTLGLRFAHTTCISQTLKEELLTGGLPIESSRVIYQGIPLERFPCKENPGTIGHPAKVLYAGQLHPYKGVHTLLWALAQLVAQGRKIELTIVGDGPNDYVASLHKQADAIPTSIDFLGRLPHDALPACYRAHDLFVFPSIWSEPFGLTHLEAMASGTPVITTIDGGQRELAQSEKNALVFHKEDHRELTCQIERLLDDPALARSLAREARKRVESDFTLAGYVEKLETYLAEIREG